MKSVEFGAHVAIGAVGVSSVKGLVLYMKGFRGRLGVQSFPFEVLGPAFRVCGSGSWSGFRVQESGFRFQRHGLGLRV